MTMTDTAYDDHFFQEAESSSIDSATGTRGLKSWVGRAPSEAKQQVIKKRRDGLSHPALAGVRLGGGLRDENIEARPLCCQHCVRVSVALSCSCSACVAAPQSASRMICVSCACVNLTGLPCITSREYEQP